MIHKVHTDGSCWPNPGGPIGHGWHTVNPDDPEKEYQGYGWRFADPKHSNNVAEFVAANEALLALSPSDISFNLFKPGDVVEVYSDSQFLVNSINRNWQGDRSKLYFDSQLALRSTLTKLRLLGVKTKFFWIPREENDRCDELSKRALIENGILTPDKRYKLLKADRLEYFCEYFKGTSDPEVALVIGKYLIEIEELRK